MTIFKVVIMCFTIVAVAASSFAGTPVPATGQTSSYAANDDGALQKGVAWPSPRFTDNTNGTVMDNLTGLTWLKNANCLEGQWASALKDIGNLKTGQCGLTDGSTAGQWRLPNVNEIESIVNAGQASTAEWLNTQGLSRVQPGYYWSSTTNASSTDEAWYVSMVDGHRYSGKKTLPYYVWPVR